MSDKKRIAIIGYGGMGSWHTRHILANDVVELAGVCDIKPARCELALERGLHLYKSIDEVLADESVDLVTIALPNELHKPVSIAAMAAGKHVICEKPVALDSGELAEMTEASKKYGKIFTVHQNRRWDCDYLLMKRIYESGELGKVFNIESRYHGSRGIPGDWRGKREHGGGMMLDWGVHLIDQMVGIVYDRKIEKIYCRCDHLTNDEVDDGFKLDIHFEGGCVGHIEVATRNFISMPRFLMCGMDGTALIQGWKDNARVVLCQTWEEHDVQPVVTAAGLTKTMAPRDEKTTVTYELERPESDVHDFYRNVVAAIDGKEEQIVKHGQLMRVMRVMEAAFESDRLGRPVDFDDR